MSEYIVTARKYRPMKFDDVDAQHHVTHTLKNAIKQNRLAHAYLFAGPRGVGKTTTARLLAKSVNCLHPSKDFEPDNECEICREITEGKSFDVLEIDGASNRGVEEIRNLRESVRYSPAKGKYKVYIIDEVHMLTKEAFNALLKTLEEPPPHVLFIFATTEVHKLPATIISRCQRFDFRRISIDSIIANLKNIAKRESLDVDDEALLLIAKKGDGSMRDSQSIFDQIVALCGKRITKEQILEALNIVDQDFYFRVTDLILARDAKGGLELVQDIMTRGYDIKEFLGGLTEHLRNIMTAATTGSTSYIEESDIYKKKYADAATQFPIIDILRLLKLVNGTEAAIRWSAQPRFKLEADLLHMITMSKASEVGEVLENIEALKKKLSESNIAASPPRLNSNEPPSVTTGNAPSFTATSKFSTRPTFTRAGETKKTPVVQPSAQVETKSTPLSEQEVSSRWVEFVAEVRRQRIAVGSVLESATYIGVTGSTIRIAANDFTSSALLRNREFLGDVIQQVFSSRGRIEVESRNVQRESISPDIGEQALPLPEPPSEDEHPVLKAMIRELGAKPL